MVGELAGDSWQSTWQYGPCSHRQTLITVQAIAGTPMHSKMAPVRGRKAMTMGVQAGASLQKSDWSSDACV